ncbi:MAG: FecR domain-containing protein [Nitrospira sp.]|nr:FecR domain-containing protein [Nitrospira sp.]
MKEQEDMLIHQCCHSGLSRIIFLSKRFPTSGNDGGSLTSKFIAKLVYVLLFLLAFVLISTGQPAAGYAEDDVGIVAALKGKAEIQRENRKIEAAVKGSILLKDTVQTKAASRAKMLFRDDSILTLGENSRLVIKDYLYAEGRKKGKTVFNLMDGKLRSLVGNNEFEVHTPTVVVAARGTYFITWTELEEGVPVSGVAVIEGLVEMWSINPAIKGVVKLERGMMSKGAMNKALTPAMPAPAALMKELIEATELQGTPEAEKKPVIEDRKGAGAQPGVTSLKEEAPSVRREAIPLTPPIINQEKPRKDTPVHIHVPIPQPQDTPVNIIIPIPDGT